MNTRYKSIAYLIKQYKRYIKKYKRLKTNFTETKNLLSATFLKKKNWLEKRLQKLMRLLSGLKTNAKKTAAVAGMAGAMALAPNVEAQNFVMRMDNPLYDHQSSGNYLWDADFADIDNDGDMDLFFTAENQTDVLFRENTGTASSPGFGPVQTNPFNISPTTYRHEEINLIDIDGDGDLDMFNTDYGIFRFFENTGNATTPAFASYQAFPFGLGFSPVYGTYGNGLHHVRRY